MLRPLFYFLCIGVSLFVLDRWLEPEPPPEPVVISQARVDELRSAFLSRTGRAPADGELDALLQAEVNDELLYRRARELGFDRDDPVVQRRLVQNMRFAGGDPARDAASLYAEALELGMDQSDPVVRRRLVQRMRLTIEARALEPEPAEAELRAHYEANLPRYRSPARARLVQLYFDGEPRGEAAALLRRLRADGVGPDPDPALSDAFLHGAEQPSQSERELAQRFGPDFARAVFALPEGEWSGPVPSSYGDHLVFVRELTPEAQRPFEAVRSEARHAVLAERRRQALDAALAKLRENVQVVVLGG